MLEGLVLRVKHMIRESDVQKEEFMGWERPALKVGYMHRRPMEASDCRDRVR